MSEAGYNRALGRLRLVAIWIVVAAAVAAARPSAAGVLSGGILVAAGETVRVWAAGHLVKNVTLVTSGPYLYTRNPLYLGRLLIFLGLCTMTELPYGLNWLLLLGGALVFFGYYLPRKERVEPARLWELHGERFERYYRAVPALWPSLNPYPEGDDRPWSASRALANREHWMVAGLLAVAVYLAWGAYSS